MLKQLSANTYIRSFLCVVLVYILQITPVFAGDFSQGYNFSDKTKLLVDQTDLLKNRLLQAQSQLAALQKQEKNSELDFNATSPSKDVRSQAALDTAVAKSNVDSISIELSESKQTINQLEKDTQEIENKLNVLSIFGMKVARTEAINAPALEAELEYQQHLLDLEKSRASYLSHLEKIADNIFQLQRAKYARINALLKSRTIMQLKERQAQSESIFQQQQSMWLERLNKMYAQLSQLNPQDSLGKANLQREIFYANENLNLAYLQMLVVRYQDQLQQLRIAISNSVSINVLNKANDQVETLSKQLVRVRDLLKARDQILEKRKNFLSVNKSVANADLSDLNRLNQVTNEYRVVETNMKNLQQKLLSFRFTLDQALQAELSSRQGLPGFSKKAWVNLGQELALIPSLTYEVVKSLGYALLSAYENITLFSMSIIAVLEITIIGLFVFVNKLLAKIVAKMPELEFGHINLARLSIQLLRRNLVSILLIANLFSLFSYIDIPSQSSDFVINLALVWLFFRFINTIARVCLLETTHDHGGHDVILYNRLRLSFIVGGVITALTVFVHQLPIIYELKDFFDRLFLGFLLVVSIFLLKSWQVLPDLILAPVDDKRVYLKRAVRMLGLLLPLIFLMNTIIGLFGFVNFVLTISWYESIFILVLVSYLVVRGVLIDGIEFLSTLLIKHLSNGWLWTEAFLKPFDRATRLLLFITSWLCLFQFYGWNQQSPVMIQFSRLINYPLVNILNTSISLVGLVEATLVISVVFWAARWTREFVYRFLSTRTQDMGLRNSLAIFSQYTTIAIGIFTCLRVLGIDFRALNVVAGAFAFGVGLGLRDLFNNFACGLLMLIERPLRVGDTVSVNEIEGIVTHIGSRAVTIKTWDNMDMLVPNAEIFSKSFINWTGKDSIVRSILSLKINRHDNPVEVQQLIHSVLASNKDVLTQPSPEVFVKELNEGLIEFEVRYFINLKLIKSRFGLRSEILLSIWNIFERNGIKPPYPHKEVYVRGGLPLLPNESKFAAETSIEGILEDLKK